MQGQTVYGKSRNALARDVGNAQIMDMFHRAALGLRQPVVIGVGRTCPEYGARPLRHLGAIVNRPGAT